MSEGPHILNFQECDLDGETDNRTGCKAEPFEANIEPQQEYSLLSSKDEGAVPVHHLHHRQELACSGKWLVTI